MGITYAVPDIKHGLQKYYKLNHIKIKRYRVDQCRGNATEFY